MRTRVQRREREPPPPATSLSFLRTVARAVPSAVFGSIRVCYAYAKAATEKHGRKQVLSASHSLTTHLSSAFFSLNSSKLERCCQ